MNRNMITQSDKLEQQANPQIGAEQQSAPSSLVSEALNLTYAVGKAAGAEAKLAWNAGFNEVAWFGHKLYDPGSIGEKLLWVDPQRPSLLGLIRLPGMCALMAGRAYANWFSNHLSNPAYPTVHELIIDPKSYIQPIIDEFDRDLRRK